MTNDNWKELVIINAKPCIFKALAELGFFIITYLNVKIASSYLLL